MQLGAGASNALRGAATGPIASARLLGVGPKALYLAVGADHPIIPGPAVIAVLAHDAVRLPCGVVLPTTAAELPLTAIGPGREAVCLVGGGQLRWTGPDGPVVVNIVREWPVSRVGHGRPAAAAVTAARAGLPTVLNFRRWSDGNPAQWGGGDRLACALLGRGPGLTPAGDDLLAGLLLGHVAFESGKSPGSGGRSATDPLADAIAALAPTRTTALSAALLAHAARGECIPEAAAFAAALAGTTAVEPALHRLLRVGHTSGAALALGLILAAEHALAADPAGAAANAAAAMAGAR
jgi:Protein of unknown function (DUF2877)